MVLYTKVICTEIDMNTVIVSKNGRHISHNTIYTGTCKSVVKEKGTQTTTVR